MAFKYATPKALFVAICDAIRSKAGTTEPIAHEDIPEAIEAIKTGATIDGPYVIYDDFEYDKYLYSNMDYTDMTHLTAKKITLHNINGGFPEYMLYDCSFNAMPAVPTTSSAISICRI